ncbi:hypothetical protein [Paenibacillus sp. MMS18-CY102]|uniref:hypothetical protein n=1 Tax=Paenibacillus sp. MMS18-CY102 TaxID=2682849 RepID=UPI001366292D|nr:hypothetical protein [Paenibacillus sp. MMS18-CY102]MWC31389.1 hypothetical protein [Paenibacillus sp. MMS18-CY102]
MQVMIPSAVFLGLMSLILGRYKMLVSEHEITVQTWLGRKSITFNEIEGVKFSPVLGGRFMLQGAGRVVAIQVETVGSAELVELLCSKVGAERCHEATEFIRKRTLQLAKYS